MAAMMPSHSSTPRAAASRIEPGEIPPRLAKPACLMIFHSRIDTDCTAACGGVSALTHSRSWGAVSGLARKYRAIARTLHSSRAHTRLHGPNNVTVPAAKSMSWARTAAASAAAAPASDSATSTGFFDAAVPASATAHTLCSCRSERGRVGTSGSARLILSPAAASGSTCAPSLAACVNAARAVR